MSPDTATLPSARESVAEFAGALDDKGAFTAFVVNGGAIDNVHALRTFVKSATIAQLADVQRALNGMEDAWMRRAALADEQRRRDDDRARLAEPLDEDEQADVDADEEELSAIAERANSVEGRLERIERLVLGLRDRLDRLSTRGAQ